ncbi:MAG TPA: minichromosome maintenance protein MCM [Candidatus Bathyarchaeia archaeon]|nr:minichromosome maintenance protein MCM [Candidatus Bathyarchaeia archaeon]HXL50522.1 minichromosome maintenance protein MCM [Candidatus Limnocylindrales bacterium]
MTALLKTARPEDVFQDLFRTHESDQVGSKYRKRLAQVAITNGKSLIIDFDDLISFDPALARSLVEKPDDYITYASSAATAQMRVEDPEYAEHVGKIFARFRRLPEKTALRKIGAEHIKKIALVDGIVVRTTQVKPTIVSAVFRCRKCLEITVLDQEGELIHGPGSHCQFCKQSTSFELLQEQSRFKNTQEARIQERPEDLPPGQLPRYLEVRLEDDLVDSARPGDRVSVTSIVRAEKQTVGERGRLRTFNIYLDANFVDVVGKETEVVEITPEDEKKILEVAQDPWVQRKLVMSLAPSIYGYEDVKEGILYLLFGGTAKQLPDGVNIRGDENVLLIGDPGTAKSQLLQYVSRIAPRGLYTSGRGTTAAGLTAAVLREKTGGMILEAGALVLADKGVACIDELDKMRPDDRVAIHEALEQQTVSVAKGGIVATLNARAAVLAAANPSLGRYEPHRNVSENINLPVTILSRFDLIFIIKDQPEADYDTRMSEHILALHRSRVSPETAPFAPDFLRKYISYAKRIIPVLSSEAVIELRDFYLKMRAKGGAEAAVAITPRQLEALVRISEARARAFLRDVVTVEDAKSAIRIMTVSLSDVGVDVKTGAMDIDVIMTGKPRSLRDSFQRVIETVAEMERETGTVEETVLIAALVDKEKMEEREARRLIGQLIKEGILYSPKPGRLKRTAG